VQNNTEVNEEYDAGGTALHGDICFNFYFILNSIKIQANTSDIDKNFEFMVLHNI
jgi:hypothetical protein